MGWRMPRGQDAEGNRRWRGKRESRIENGMAFQQQCSKAHVGHL
jgi:hypothetical protein